MYKINLRQNHDQERYERRVHSVTCLFPFTRLAICLVLAYAVLFVADLTPRAIENHEHVVRLYKLKWRHFLNFLLLPVQARTAWQKARERRYQPIDKNVQLPYNCPRKKMCCALATYMADSVPVSYSQVKLWECDA